MIWPHVTKQNPCPICGKPDWCSIGDYSILCQRVESTHPHKAGGWFHPKGKELKFYQHTLAKKTIADLHDGAEMRRQYNVWHYGTTAEQVRSLAVKLGVLPEALEYLGAAFTESVGYLHGKGTRLWAFPMRDADYQIVGVRMRTEAGQKWAFKGSKNGLFIPTVDPLGDLLICEGPTTCAALLSMGYWAVGRASCNTGAEYLKAYMKNHGVKKTIIVSDMDDREHADGTAFNPGLQGATQLARVLGVRCAIWKPPYGMDVRNLVREFGWQRKQFDSAFRQLIWTFVK